MGEIHPFPGGRKEPGEDSEVELLIQIGRQISRMRDLEARTNLTIAWRREAVRLCGRCLTDLDR